MPKSVYIHIPFCLSKCFYCSFISFPKMELKKDYLKALKKEIKTNYKNEVLHTLYFGGGTPSLLDVSEVKDIIECFKINSDTEITMELNPDGHQQKGLTKDYLNQLYDIGINRISIGAQSFDDEILKKINRRHNSAQIIQAVENAKTIGFDNINLDFIYGLPNQTQKMFLNDLEKGVNLGITHISLYGLTIEKGCYFYKNKPENIADDDKQADMYLKAVELLEKLGFEHYEFSNFCKSGYESKHNLNYWNNEEYYGFGTAAHGYLNGVRYGNQETIEEYIVNPLKHKEERKESWQDKFEEEIFLGFRKMCGINTEWINSKYGIDFDKKYSDILKKYEKSGHIKKTENGYKLTPQGVLVSNTILAEFIE